MDRPRREVQRRRVHEEIVEYLLEDIKNGVYTMGEELPSERSLMEEFQVGRPAIRESLLKLERMGFIETRPGVRAKVCEPTVSPLLKDMTDVVQINLQNPLWLTYFQEARCLFESALARAAAEKFDEERIKQLKNALESNKTHLDDISAFANADVAFHKIIADATENPIFSILYHHLNKWLLEQRRTTLAVPGQALKALNAHKKIYEALAAHNADMAGQAMQEHLLQIQSVYQSMTQEKAKE